jgi:Ca2+-transporting ATPase
MKKQILDQAARFSEQALRVLGFAFGEWKEEKNLTFVWLQAMIDPPREEVKDSIATCKNAWIRVIMITWDNKVTAWAIARELWIEWDVITGADFEKSKNKAELLETVWVIARVNPSDKQEIVNILRKRWNVVAMTWDGVNDAPSIKAADIWVWMWITGTDVTKEAADMILTDDNFKSIVNAVEEWRWIYDNIQKFVNYMIVSNICEIAILFVASLIWVPIPLLAIHLLWLNVITDGLPAIALWIDPINPNVMNRKPRKATQWLIDGRMILNIILLSSSVTIWTLILFLRWQNVDLEMARSAVFLFMAASELVKIQIIRSQYGLSFFSNKWLIWALLWAFGLAFSIVYIPGINTLFDLQPLSAEIREEMWIILAVFIGIWTALSEYMKRSKTFQKWEDGE